MTTTTATTTTAARTAPASAAPATSATATAGPAVVLQAIAGIGGPLGVTVDDRAASASSAANSGVGAVIEPVFRWGLAPAGLATRRQLAACGLRPGGRAPVAFVSWRRGRRWAALYELAGAPAKRECTPRRRAALVKAMAARRRCPRCGRDVGYVIPSSLGCCLDCHDCRDAPAEPEPACTDPPADPDTTPPETAPAPATRAGRTARVDSERHCPS